MNSVNHFDVVIVNYNSTNCLINCLQSAYDDLKGVVADFFVIDNGSTDNADRVKSFYPDVHLEKVGKNIGFACAVNRGIEKSRASYIVLLNPDTLVKKGFFESTWRYMEEHSEVGVLGPLILNYDQTVQGSARSFPNAVTALFGRNSVISRLFPNNSITRRNLLTTLSDGKTPMEVDWVSGACMVVRKAAYKNVGLMDQKFFMYWEDADWCRRMHANGWKVIYFPAAAITHYIGISSEQNLFKSIVEFHRSVYYYFKKYASAPVRLLKPAVFATLCARMIFVLILRHLQRWNGGLHAGMEKKGTVQKIANRVGLRL